MVIEHFYHEQISKAAELNHIKTISYKRGLVVNFEHVT